MVHRPHSRAGHWFVHARAGGHAGRDALTPARAARTVDATDGLAPATRPLHKPLRFCVSNVFRTLSLGTAVAGKLETGYVLPGDKVRAREALRAANQR